MLVRRDILAPEDQLASQDLEALQNMGALEDPTTVEGQLVLKDLLMLVLRDISALGDMCAPVIVGCAQDVTPKPVFLFGTFVYRFVVSGHWQHEELCPLKIIVPIRTFVYRDVFPGGL
jgi:hypothetical protein